MEGSTLLDALAVGEAAFQPRRGGPLGGSARYSPYETASTDQVQLDMLLAGMSAADVEQAGEPGEFCQFFSKSGWCKWGDGCRYKHDGPASGAPMQAELCQFFSKAGWCQWADQCKYIHALPTAATGPASPTLPAQEAPAVPGAPAALPGLGLGGGKGPPLQIACEFYSKAGWCKWGDGCRYVHCGTPRGMPGALLSGMPPQPRTLLTGSPSVCKYYSMPGGCKNGEMCTFAHVGTPGMPELCQFFQKAGWCKWGDQCKYVHAGGPVVPLCGGGGGGKGQPGLPGNPCQFFQKAGWCKWGDGCRYSHVGGPEHEMHVPVLDGQRLPFLLQQQGGVGSPIQEVCQFFAKSGWCKWADGCKYIHSAEPLPSSLEGQAVQGELGGDMFSSDAPGIEFSEAILGMDGAHIL